MQTCRFVCTLKLSLLLTLGLWCDIAEGVAYAVLLIVRIVIHGPPRLDTGCGEPLRGRLAIQEAKVGVERERKHKN